MNKFEDQSYKSDWNTSNVHSYSTTCLLLFWIVYFSTYEQHQEVDRARYKVFNYYYYRYYIISDIFSYNYGTNPAL